MKLTGKAKLTNVTFDTDNGLVTFDFDFDVNDGAQLPPVDIPPVGNALPPGFNDDINVGYSMLKRTVDKHSMNAVAFQGRGKEICALLNEDWPGLGCYAHKVTDAVMWRDFGSLDVTVDSGKGNSAFPDGWYFNPDGHNKYGEGR